MASNLIYEVECELDPDIVADYDAWLPGHVQDVLACAGFLGATIETPETPPGTPHKRIIRYELASAAALDQYLENEATRLRTQTAERFGGRVHCRRRTLKARHDLVPAARMPVTCLDCGAAVTGAHCPQCGQAANVHVLSMKEVAGDVTHSLLHLDSRVWRTLRLLVRHPGELTREFIAGRHQRYLPPFRLYLAISIVFFALSALLPGNDLVELDESARASLAAGELSADVRKEMLAAGVDPGEIENLAKAPEERCQFRSPPLGSKDLEAPLKRACEKIVADGGARLAERFASTAPKLMFVFLPLMAAVALLFYWRPRRLYTEHLVLFLHNHAFTFLLIGVMQVVDAIASINVPVIGIVGFLNLPLFLYLPWYVYKSMRVVYGQGRLRTILKFFVLSTIYFLLLGITMFAGLVYSMMSL